MPLPTLTSVHGLTIDIGDVPVLVQTDNPVFAHMLADRYGEFVAADAPHAVIELEIQLVKEAGLGVAASGDETWDTGLKEDDDADPGVSVRVEGGRWVMERGDFRAEWDPPCHRGWVRQSANPYALDGVLRILHSLILAREGGFLVHAASAVRNGQAFVFAGVSGAGKTTLSRLAPPGVTLLSDEISYIRDTGYGTPDTGTESAPGFGPRAWTSNSPITNHQSRIASAESRTPSPVSRIPAFQAFGTPFAGELARIGQKVHAPLATLFLLRQGPENRIEALSESQAVRELLRHVLFFARDKELVGMTFQTVCDFVRSVPVRRLVFTPDATVWELIV